VKNLLISLLFLTGCVPQSKLAKVCAERYPIREDVKEVINTEVVYLPSDTILVHFKDTVLPVICPPNKTITRIKEVVKTQENTAKTVYINTLCDKSKDSLNKIIVSYKSQLEDCKQKEATLKKRLKKSNSILAVILGIGLLLLFIKVVSLKSLFL
jgi:hypothetical protein